MLASCRNIALAVAIASPLLAAHAAVATGTFSLQVTDPGSETLATPFSGTFTFDTAVSNPPTHSDGLLFNIRVLSAELDGGDEIGGCCYVLDTAATQPDVVYRLSGDPFSLSLFFLNDAQGTRLALSFSGSVASPTLRWSQDRLNPTAGTYTGIRGGTYSFDAPLVQVSTVPEPGSVALVAFGILALASLRLERASSTRHEV